MFFFNMIGHRMGGLGFPSFARNFAGIRGFDFGHTPGHGYNSAPHGFFWSQPSGDLFGGHSPLSNAQFNYHSQYNFLNSFRAPSTPPQQIDNGLRNYAGMNNNPITPSAKPYGPERPPKEAVGENIGQRGKPALKDQLNNDGRNAQNQVAAQSRQEGSIAMLDRGYSGFTEEGSKHLAQLGADNAQSRNMSTGGTVPNLARASTGLTEEGATQYQAQLGADNKNSREAGNGVAMPSADNFFNSSAGRGNSASNDTYQHNSDNPPDLPAVDTGLGSSPANDYRASTLKKHGIPDYNREHDSPEAEPSGNNNRPGRR